MVGERRRSVFFVEISRLPCIPWGFSLLTARERYEWQHYTRNDKISEMKTVLIDFVKAADAHVLAEPLPEGLLAESTELLRPVLERIFYNLTPTLYETGVDKHMECALQQLQRSWRHWERKRESELQFDFGRLAKDSR